MNFRVIEVRDTRLRSSLLKNIHLSHDFEPFSNLEHEEKCLCKCLFVRSVLITSGLESQSKFQMFTLFSGCHIGVPRMYTNIAFSYSITGLWETFTTNN